MVSLLNSMLENKSLHDVAKAWGVSSDQAARRVREVPFVVLDHVGQRGGSRGRPGRRLALNPRWRFSDHAGNKPLGQLVELLHRLYGLGEPFALGVPFTSTFLQPFLNPEVRLLAPPETFSLWRRLFDGAVGTLRVTVDLLPKAAHPVEMEGLPVLDRPFATVDAVLGFQGTKNLNVLALADWLSHQQPLPEDAMSFATDHGLDRDVRYLEDHRRAEGWVVRAVEVREAHQRANQMARAPSGTAFHELLEREAWAGD